MMFIQLSIRLSLGQEKWFRNLPTLYVLAHWDAIQRFKTTGSALAYVSPYTFAHTLGKLFTYEYINAVESRINCDNLHLYR